MFRKVDKSFLWNPSINEPQLKSGIGREGIFYIVSESGERDLDGITKVDKGDTVAFQNMKWVHIPTITMLRNKFKLQLLKRGFKPEELEYDSVECKFKNEVVQQEWDFFIIMSA